MIKHSLKKKYQRVCDLVQNDWALAAIMDKGQNGLPIIG
jgi:hypothetical protein